MAQLFSNNASGTLSAGITDVATSIVLDTGQGAAFNSPTGGDFELVTLTDGTNIEIVKVTARSTDTLTVERAQEGTTGFAFSLGDTVEARLTAATMDRFKEGRAGLFQDVTELVYTMSTAAVDASNGNRQLRTLAANETPTFTIGAGQSVYVRYTLAGFSLTMTNVTEWIGGTPTLGAELQHAFVFLSDDGTNISGKYLGGVA